MKKIADISMFIMLVVFGLGLGMAAAACDWAVFCWVITGLLWFLFYWFSKIRYEEIIDEIKEQHEERLKDLRKNRDDYMGLYNHYWNKYDEKLQQNIDLAQENVDLCQKNLMLAEKNKMMSEYIQKNLPGYQGDPRYPGVDKNGATLV